MVTKRHREIRYYKRALTYETRLAMPFLVLNIKLLSFVVSYFALASLVAGDAWFL